MSSDHPQIVKDFMPGWQYLEFECLKTFVSHISFFLCAGVYYFSKIVNYSDLEPLKPASTTVQGVEWDFLMFWCFFVDVNNPLPRWVLSTDRLPSFFLSKQKILYKTPNLPAIEPLLLSGGFWVQKEIQEQSFSQNHLTGWSKPKYVFFQQNYPKLLIMWTQLATTETLGHYRARLAESDYNQTVELKSRWCFTWSVGILIGHPRHVLDDYKYTANYLEKWVIKSTGGASMEFHDFAHLDCPLSSISESGHFVLARWTDEAKTAMEITAFKVTSSWHLVL